MSEERPDPKGKITADISLDAVAEALRSVEARSRGEEPEAPGVVIESEDEPAGAEDGGADPAELAALKEELKQKDMMLEQSQKMGRTGMERLKEANERMLRAAADLENYKKRAQKEKEELQKYGIEKLLKDLLPVLDNFDRALEHADKGADLKSFSEGVGMTRKLFESTLGKFGVKGFSAVGETFDPHRHEAIQQAESADYPAHVVLSEIVRGYLLNDRLVRPAMVIVSTGPGPAGQAAPEQPEVASEAAAETVRLAVAPAVAKAADAGTAEEAVTPVAEDAASEAGGAEPGSSDPGKQHQS